MHMCVGGASCCVRVCVCVPVNVRVCMCTRSNVHEGVCMYNCAYVCANFFLCVRTFVGGSPSLSVK